MRHKIVLGAIALTVVALISIGGYLRFGRSVQKTLINTVAVIPFANGSDNSEMEFLSDGISESLINSLSQQPDIKVIARSSSFKYKGLEVDPLEVARTLDVEAILTGRVALLGDNLVISTELTDARDNTQIWGQQYRRKATDLLLTQAEIAREIAQKLRLTLTAPQQQQLTKLETANPQAYEMLLRGRFYREKGGTEDLKRAVGFYKRAIAMDPAYARAYVELSSLYTFLSNVSVLDPKEYLPQAEAAARKALELDDTLAEAHLTLANLELAAWDWPAAARDFERALELSPVSPGRAFGTLLS